MVNSILYRSLLFVACVSVFADMQASHHDKASHHDEPSLTADGPYILYSIDGSARVISVNGEGHVSDTTYATLPRDYSFEVVSHDGKHRFPVSLHHVERPAWHSPQPDKLFVLSDPHGDLDSME